MLHILGCTIVINLLTKNSHIDRVETIRAMGEEVRDHMAAVGLKMTDKDNTKIDKIIKEMVLQKGNMIGLLSKIMEIDSMEVHHRITIDLLSKDHRTLIKIIKLLENMIGLHHTDRLKDITREILLKNLTNLLRFKGRLQENHPDNKNVHHLKETNISQNLNIKVMIGMKNLLLRNSR